MKIVFKNRFKNGIKSIFTAITYSAHFIISQIRKISFKNLSLIIKNKLGYKVKYYSLIIKDKLYQVIFGINFYVLGRSIKEYVLKIFFGEMYIFKTEEYTISFNNMPLLRFTNLNCKVFAFVWNFIYSSCHFYHSHKDFTLSPYQQEEINKFFEQFQIVSKEDYFDKENEDIIGIYKNYFKADPKGKLLRSNIIKLSNEINYPSLVLDVIKLYSTMLQTYGDPELDLIPNKKDRLAIMNVDLGYFISTKQELEIFIESLELELKDVIYSNSNYRSYIETLIRTLKLSLKNNFKDSSSCLKKNISEKLSIFLFIISPLGFYTLFNQISKFLPFMLIYLFFLWFIYYCYKFFLPYLETRQFYLGLINLFKQIFKYIWSQKIMFFIIIINS